MRHFWSLLLAALLTARTASAQVATVPPSAGVAAVGSAAAGAAPLAQYTALRHGDISAALTFIHAPALQEWLWASRPAQAAGVLSLAHRLADVGQVARAYKSNPTGMRQALLARADDSLVQEPGMVGGIVASNHFLEGSLHDVRSASCSWDSLEEYERESLTARGHTEAAWRDYELTRRVELLRKLWFESLQARLPKSVLDPHYAPTLRSFLKKRAGTYLSNREYWSIAQDAERAERLAVRVAEARARAESSGDEAALRGLASVAENNDVNRARKAFDRVFAGAQDGTVLTEIPPTVPGSVLNELAVRLPAVIRALAEGTPAAEMLDEAKRLKPLRVAFNGMPAGTVAHYLPKPDLIELNPEDLSHFLRAEQRSAEELLSDPALLGRYALALAPIFIHEATHARQVRLLTRRGLTAPASYQQDMEVEAFSVQGAFALAYAERSPEAKETIKALASHSELSDLIHGWASIASPVKRVRATYASVKGRDRAWSDTVQAVRSLAPYRQGTALLAQAELARRRRLPAVERMSFERDGSDSGAIVLVKTSLLRRVIARADTNSRAILIAVTAANDEIMANARRALKTFYSLRP